jgi:hypothetical protein
MNLLSVDFQELYQRHLCRHSQFGINMAHLASVLGTYVIVGSLVYALAAPTWTLLALVVPYLAILAFNIPLRVFLLNMVFIGMLLLVCWTLPPFPVWCYPLLLLLFHKLQAWSHKIYRRETDMTEFDKKYPKGITRFVLLSIYELPLLLNYLFFGKKDWHAGNEDHPATSLGDLATRLGEKAALHANRNDSATV